MSNTTLSLTRELHQYLLEHSLREGDIQRRLRKRTSELPEHNMQIAPEQGQFMQLLLRLMQARKGIEIGTFTGYSALCMASALPQDGHLLCCDVSEEWVSVGRPYWQEAGILEKISVHIAPALDTLSQLREERQAGTYDFAFIDADKENYQAYFDNCLSLLRPGGLVMVDNTLWGGAVIDASDKGSATRAIRRFNERIAADERVELSQLPVADGLTLALKK
ncbi:MAG: O-methyltransferase [bacterium]